MSKAIKLGNEIKSKLLLEKTEIDIKAEKEYHKKFLEVTGLKINDIVSCYFTTNHGTPKQSFTQVVEVDGILKQYANGTLYVQSVEKLKKSTTGKAPLYLWEYSKTHLVTTINNIQ